MSKTCLDHVLVNNVSMSYNVDILPYDLFDHSLIITEINNEKLNELKSDKSEIDKERLKHVNIKKFTENVKNEKIFYNTNKSMSENY